LLSARGWPLAVVLAVQAALSVRLLWANTAEIDEGFYLSSGYLELSHLFRHAAMPDVASFMSGAPVVYPPLGALANDIGGLAGARALSLAFLLLATAALHGVSRRLLGSRSAALLAAALFGWLGPTQFLGSLATFDAMSLTLLALATWVGVRAVESSGPARYALVTVAGLTMAAADAAKYAAALFNPVVILIVAAAAWRGAGRRAGVAALGTVAASVALPLAAGYKFAGAAVRAGVSSTTLDRPASSDSVGAVLHLAASTTGIIAVLAVLGVIVLTARRPGWPAVTLGWTLTAAVFLAPAEQARIHTLESLFKHADFGAWFACVPAGYLLAQLPAWLSRERGAHARAHLGASLLRPRWTSRAGAVACCAVVLASGALGVPAANSQRAAWPDSGQMITVVGRLVQPNGIYLIEDPYVVTYYLRTKVTFDHVIDTYGLYYTDPQTHRAMVGIPAWADAIKHGYFTGIVLNFGDTYQTDQMIAGDIDRFHTYKLADVIGYRSSYGAGTYRIWLRRPPRATAGTPGAPSG
jgi:4-amino-4-deoxy-L-arabinose transferase-like glycosyltransferase